MASTEKLLRIVLKLEDQMSKELDKAGDSLSRVSSNLTNVGTKMTAAITAPLVGIGIAASKMSMDFDAAMRNIQSISKQSDESLGQLGQTFKDMSMDMSLTVDSAQNLAEAFYSIQGSGFEGADAMKVLEAATKAASAGMTTTAVAAEGMIAVMNSYGLSAADAARVSDIMFETVNRGVGTFEQLSSSMSNVVGMANALGVPFEEVSAAMATMSKQGFSFAEASVAINQAMSSLLKPTSEGEAMIRAMGYSSGEAMIEALGFAGSLQKIEEFTGGSATEMSKLFSNVRGLRAALALTGDGAAMFAEDLDAMMNSAGATQAAFEIQMQSFQAAWKNFQNTVGVALMEIGDILLPFLATLLTDYITPLINAFISLDDTTQGWIVAILAVVAAIGPLLLIIGQIAGAIVAIKSAVLVIAPAFAALKLAVMGFGATALAALAPFIPLILAIVAASALLWAVATNFMGIRDKIGEAVGGIMEFLGNLAGAWGEMIKKAGTSLSQLGTIIWEALKGLGKAAWELGVSIIEGLLKGMASMAIDLIGFIFGLSQDLTNAVKEALGIASPSKVMMNLGENVVKGFHEGIEGMGGIGVTVPKTNAMPMVSGDSASFAGATGGGGNIYIQTLNVPAGTSKEQVDYIMKEVGKASSRRGAKKTRR